MKLSLQKHTVTARRHWKPRIRAVFSRRVRSRAMRRKRPYQLAPARRDYAGVILSLARQEHPDTSAYNDDEIACRVGKFHHAGFILKSASHQRIQQLLDSYSRRFIEDFLATQPVPEK